MTLLNPAALIFTVLAPVIVLLYLLKLRRLPARVSTLMFWQRVTADHRRRALFQRLRQVLSLLLHLLIFALLLFALARPELAAFLGGGGTAASTVIIVDCRARMQARDGAGSGTTHFDLARRMAAGYLRRASAQNSLALLAAGSTPEVLAGFSDDEKALAAGLAQARPTDAGGRIEDAIRLAGDLLAARAGERKIVVLTDRVPPEAKSEASAPMPPVEWHTVVDPKTALENVGITRLTARPLLNSPQTDEVLLEVQNFGPTRQTGSIELTFDGRPLDVKPFDLSPGGRSTEIYPALAARTNLANARGWLLARLAPDSKADALALDDQAYAVIPPLQPLRVLLVTRGNWFLEGLFKADEQIEFNQLAPDSFQPAQAAGFDVVVLDNVLPAGIGRLEDLPPGNFLFVRQAPLPGGAAGDAGAAAAAASTIDHPIVTDTDKDSPLLRLADLRDISFVRASDWKVPVAGSGGSASDWRFATPVSSLEHPLVVTGERSVPGDRSGTRRTQRFVALAFSATDSVELPLRVAFPLFVRNCVSWLGGQEAAAAGEWSEAAGLRAGETLRLAAGETLWTVPQKAYQALPGTIPPGEILAGPAIFQLAQDGFYLRRSADGATHWLAANTFDAQVSALNAATSSTGADVAQPGSSPAPQADAGLRALAGWWEIAKVWPPWVYLSMAALAICTLEWWGFHRRRTE